MLLDGGTDVNHKNYLGRTALFISENTGKPEITRMLKEAGAVE
jgi:ankyrin repeat protein